MEIRNKRQFLISRYPLPRRFLYEPRGWHDTAVLLKETYFKNQSEDTIFGQMLLIEIELDKLKKSKEQEKNVEKLKSIDSKIKELSESFRIREEYLCKKQGNNFEDWSTAKRKSLNIEFWKGQERQCIDRINELSKSINDDSKFSSGLASEFDYNPDYAYYRDIEDEVRYDIRCSQKEIDKERGNLKTIRQAAKNEGVDLCQ